MTIRQPSSGGGFSPTFSSLYATATSLSAPSHVCRELPDAPVGYDHQLPIGAPGKVGFLYATVAAARGKSVIAERMAKAPLVLMNPLYTDMQRPETPVLYIMSTGAGLAQNDRQLVDIRVGGEEPASALITTQAATPIHRMDVGMAVQHVTMTVSAGSVLEYIPDHVVPYGGSRSHLSLEAIVSSGGCAIVSDCVTAGRLGRGERHSYDVLSMETQISQRLRVSSGHNGLFRNRVRPLARDRGVFSPHTGGGLVGMRNFGAWANVWIIAPSSASTLSVLEAVRELPTPASSGTLRWAASTLPYESGVWVRILSATAEEAREARDAVWTTARMVLLGASAPRLRKY